MHRDDLVELLSPEGLRLLDSLPRFESNADVVKTVSELRAAGHSPKLVATVLTQSRLRAKAAAKFGDFATRMLFTESGLEQATRLRVAALHAGRFAAAGARRIGDLGCGIGGDAMAMAAIDLDVVAVEADEVTAAVASYNLAPFPNARVEQADAAEVDLSDIDAVFLDPARRTHGHTDTRRLTDPADYSPSLDFAFGLRSKRAVGVKLGPGFDRSLIPDEAEAQWVSDNGDVVELGLWFGVLGRPGVRRAALVLSSAGAAELTAQEDSPDAETGPLGEIFYEPDGAVIRARLIGDLARSLNARMLSNGIAYFSSDSDIPTPFATRYRVLETLPSKEAELKRALRDRGIGTLEIKKRGVDVDPAALRRRLALHGERSATIVLTRVQGRHRALLVERLTA
jgi:THUMP domain-like